MFDDYDEEGYEGPRCPMCGADAEDSMFFDDDDVDQEQPYCECGYVWPVAVDIQLVNEPTDDELPPLDFTPLIPPYER